MSSVFFKEQGWGELTKRVSSTRAVILHDSNTKICLEHLYLSCAASRDLPRIEIPAGEFNKRLKTCEKVWYELTELGADRNTLLINLGGGVVTDLGAFAASTYLRGIPFVHIPTSLLGMVDAAVGGKTGVDFGGLKNMIGTFARPMAVIIDSNFLRTLPNRQYTNGLAEVLKHAFISDTGILDLMYANEDELISRSVNVKMEVVENDEFEKGERKKLNFGHTLGHAIESHFLESETPVLHGEAVAAGMILEAFISMSSVGLAQKDFDQILKMTDSIFKRISISNSDCQNIKRLLIHDKKNLEGLVNFVLLKKMGEAIIDQKVSETELDSAFEFYSQKT